jgi:rhamnosyltransferase
MRSGPPAADAARRPLVSVVIRTLNEARYLDELLDGIAAQDRGPFEVETVIIDSGSTDGTLAIAERHGCRITHISREQFSFGRSLNMGCEFAHGSILVLISGHCVPAGPGWLRALCEPVHDGRVSYSYGRQLGGPESSFSECRIFAKYFPAQSMLPQPGFFCNNANSAIARSAWERHRFDEEVTGLEDMELAQRLHREGARIGYVADAAVYHYHSEGWAQVRRRFEREALALQKIMPQIHVRRRDTVRYISSSIWRDWRHAARKGEFWRHAWAIVRYRSAQYSGSFRGNHEHRRLSHAEKEKYFYPD